MSRAGNIEVVLWLHSGFDDVLVEVLSHLS